MKHRHHIPPPLRQPAEVRVWGGEEGKAQPNTMRDKLQHYRARVLKRTLPGSYKRINRLGQLSTAITINTVNSHIIITTNKHSVTWFRDTKSAEY